jgi:phytoene dehydrogenase-like protein
MPAVMATEGVWVPEGGPYELVAALARLAEASGVEVRTEAPVERVERGGSSRAGAVHEADVVVADLDADRLESLLSATQPSARAWKGCSPKFTRVGFPLVAGTLLTSPPATPRTRSRTSL